MSLLLISCILMRKSFLFYIFRIFNISNMNTSLPFFKSILFYSSASRVIGNDDEEEVIIMALKNESTSIGMLSSFQKYKRSKKVSHTNSHP